MNKMMSLLFFFFVSFTLISSQLTWTELTPSSVSSPDPRIRSALAYDSTNNILIIFGGLGDDDVYFDDTWIFNLTSLIWTQLTTTNNPDGRFDALGGFNTRTKQFVISTGESKKKFYGDIWSLTLDNYSSNSYAWTKLDFDAKTKPEKRYGVAGGLDIADENIFYISHGFSTKRHSNAFRFNISDINKNWKEIFEGTNSYNPNKPHARCLVATNPLPNGFIMIGGCLSSGFAGGPCPGLDSWTYIRGKGWTQMEDMPIPNINADSCKYWGDDKHVITYGGVQDLLPLQKMGGEDIKKNQVQIVNIKSKKWNVYTTSNSPSKSITSHRMIETVNGCLLFGGENSKDKLNTVYLLSGTINNKDKKDDVKAYFSLLAFHGIFMWISWGIVLQLGGFIARYFRHRDPWWFRPMHLYCQRGGFTISLLGIIFVFMGGGNPLMAHGVIGIIILLISIFQVIYGECRPHHGDKYRWLFELLHKNSGRTALLLGLINISLGVLLIVSPPGVWITWFIQLSIYVVVYVIFELNKRGIIHIKYLDHPKKEDDTTAHSPVETKDSPETQEIEVR